MSSPKNPDHNPLKKPVLPTPSIVQIKWIDPIRMTILSLPLGFILGLLYVLAISGKDIRPDFVANPVMFLVLPLVYALGYSVLFMVFVGLATVALNIGFKVMNGGPIIHVFTSENPEHSPLFDIRKQKLKERLDQRAQKLAEKQKEASVSGPSQEPLDPPQEPGPPAEDSGEKKGEVADSAGETEKREDKPKSDDSSDEKKKEDADEAAKSDDEKKDGKGSDEKK